MPSFSSLLVLAVLLCSPAADALSLSYDFKSSERHACFDIDITHPACEASIYFYVPLSIYLYINIFIYIITCACVCRYRRAEMERPILWTWPCMTPPEPP